MATRLKNLTLNEVAMVDRGANQHAHITLFKREAEPVEKDMYDVSRFADMLSSLAYLTRSATYEAADEGDNSPVPARLKGWLQSGAQIFQQMAAEEISELIAATDVSKTQTQEDDTAMPTEIEKKAADEQIKKLADTEAALVKAQKENAFLKLSDVHKAYVVEKALSDEEKEAFVAKSEAERDAQIKASPVEKKVDPEIAKRDQENADLRKRLEAVETEAAKSSFAKKAVDLGLPESEGETLRKAHSGDKAAIEKLEGFIKGLTEQVKTGKLFEEFGTVKGSDATTPKAKVDAKVAEMQKADSKLTRAQAVAKIAEDPAQRELWNEYKAAGAAA